MAVAEQDLVRGPQADIIPFRSHREPTSVSPTVVQGFEPASSVSRAFEYVHFTDVHADVREDLALLLDQVRSGKVMRGVFEEGQMMVSFDMGHPRRLHNKLHGESLVAPLEDGPQPPLAFELRRGEEGKIAVALAKPDPIRHDIKGIGVLVSKAAKEHRKYKKHFKQEAKRAVKFFERNAGKKSFTFEARSHVRI